MEVALILMFLFGFWAVIRWDQKRLKDVQPNERMKPVVLAGPLERGKQAVHACWGLAAVAASVAVVEYFEPSKPPFSGRFAWLKEFALAVFGHHGLAALWLLLAVALVASSAFVWRRTPKRPSDRIVG